MALEDDLRSEIRNIFLTRWQTREGRVVPEPENVALGNDAVTLEATVLYADLVGSTRLVDERTPSLAAEVYKTFLAASCRVIREQGGAITSFDGDRVMAVFIGDNKNSNAATAALKINHVVTKLINPELSAIYKENAYSVQHVIGIDTSTLFVARTGIRNANDLVWVGRAANYAAKLCDLRNPLRATWITEAVFTRLNETAKFGGVDKKLMWERNTWVQQTAPIYSSTWTWKP